MSAPESRPYDLVLFGATGYTGRLTAIYLACARPKSLRWALAGRDRAKLESIRKELATIDESLGNLRILIADSADEASLRTMVASTRVVCSTVGPYAKYGHGLVTSAAEAGTHYCDLTGETTFVRQTIDRCHATAEKNSARIVPCCGFDSVPSDLGVFELAQSFASEGATLAQATLHVESLRGGASGGTLASMFTLLEEARQLLSSQARPEEMEEIFKWMYNNLELFSKTLEGQDEAILAIRKGAANVSLVADQEINLSATLVELSQIG